MILDLPDTNTGAINKKIVSLREEGGAITLGRVLTLVVAPDTEAILEEAIDAANLSADTIKTHDNLLLGTSTWGAGELQDDWYDGVKVLKAAGISHKFVALFGCGDSDSYSDTFCNGMGNLYEELKETGCTFCGRTETDGYTFDSSISVVDGKFVGLALDEVNQDDLTDQRIDNWIEKLKTECLN